MLKNFVKLFSSDPTKKTVAQLGDLAVQINLLEPEFEKLSDEALRAKTDEFQARIASALRLIPVGEGGGGWESWRRRNNQSPAGCVG